MWEESNPELDRLKKQSIAHETRAANLAQQLHNAEEQLSELRNTHKEDVYKLQQQATELIVAQELARKRTELRTELIFRLNTMTLISSSRHQELKIIQVQNANFQQHGAALEREVESSKQEIKQLNYGQFD